MPGPDARQPRLLTAIAMAMVLLGGALFAYRGLLPITRPGANMDTALVSVPPRVWLQGGNPYDPGAIDAAWLAAGGEADFAPGRRGRQAFVYPPGAYLLGAPFALVPLEATPYVWGAVNAAMLVACWWLIAGLAGIKPTSPAGLALLAAALAMGPAHTNSRLGQTGVLVLFLCALAWTLRSKDRQVLAGVALGVACAVKPQIGLIFAIYELGRGRWRVFAGAVAVGGLLTLAGAARLWIEGVDVFAQWFMNMRALTEVDANPLHRHPDQPLSNPTQLINLASPIAVVIGDTARANLGAMLYCAGGALAYLMIDLRRGYTKTDVPGELVTLCAVSVVMLLVAYHRIYDAVFLLPLAALAIVLWRERRRAGAIALAAPLALLWLPGPPLLLRLAIRGQLPDPETGPMLWRSVVLTHHTWALVACFGVLCVIRLVRTSDAETP
ncbi:MAG: glycosyltransferase family 87 protein [Planctomycetota bacterium]